MALQPLFGLKVTRLYLQAPLGLQVDNPWAKVLPEVLQADRQALLPVHPVHLAAPLLEQKHQPCLLVLPQAKLQAASCQAVQQV